MKMDCLRWPMFQSHYNHHCSIGDAGGGSLADEVADASVAADVPVADGGDDDGRCSIAAAAPVLHEVAGTDQSIAVNAGFLGINKQMIAPTFHSY